MDDIFSPEATAAALKRLDADQAPNEVHAGVVGQNGDVGVQASGNVALGKGAFVEGEASWFKRTGYSFAAMIGWRKKP